VVLRGEQIFPYFFAVRVVLATVGFYFYSLNKNAAFKRKYFPWFEAVASVVFVLFMVLMEVPLQVRLFVVPALLVISRLNIRLTRFCSSFGTTVIGSSPFSRPDYCSKYGAKLEG